MIELTEQLVKARVTVGLVILLLESAFVQLSQTECAYEVFRVELSKHGRDAAACDWFVTTGAKGAAFAMVVGFAVGLSFMLEERTAMERLAAFLADETIWMPLRVKS